MSCEWRCPQRCGIILLVSGCLMMRIHFQLRFWNGVQPIIWYAGDVLLTFCGFKTRYLLKIEHMPSSSITIHGCQLHFGQMYAPSFLDQRRKLWIRGHKAVSQFSCFWVFHWKLIHYQTVLCVGELLYSCCSPFTVFIFVVSKLMRLSILIDISKWQ